MTNNTFALGARITAREEDFLITGLTENFDGSFLIDAEGISELVNGKTFKFDTRIDTEIRVLDAAKTKLKADDEFGYRRTKLFLETQLRNSTNYGEKISVAHKAAFNVSNFQFEPTVKAFKLPRPRILIADGVGLGKTIEAGIFLAEMIKRGKGKRIMVLALKSILGQFQQEIWSRFAIPLVKLDSQGIAKISTELPINKNPFEYYDKTIVSIDAFKSNMRLRGYIEKSKWDIIVIDECHTVANSSSQRGNLAQLLAGRCESLILTSATPHNGKKESFANLIKMIEPTAIPRTGDYGKTDVEPYYVRRFKQHIADEEVRSHFMDRRVIPIHAELFPEEEKLLQIQQNIKFEALSNLKEDTEFNLFDESTRKERKDFLFSMSLFKAYMSSPQAALKSIENRINTIKALTKLSNNAEDDINLLEEIQGGLTGILTKRADSKYNAFKNKLIELGWNGRKRDERIVVFTERIETIKHLRENILKDFNVDEKAIAVFHGSLTDMEQQKIVEDFGSQDSKIRILITSDAGSQGVNLHYYCNIMFNYDIPWSLITLEQRNGRIDRYGQSKTPYIYYLIGKSDIEGLKTDLHIMENLTKKEEEVYNTLGDAGSVLKLYDVESEEKRFQKEIAKQNKEYLSPGENVDEIEIDEDSLFGGESDVTESIIEEDPIEEGFSLYKDDSSYYRDLIDQLKTEKLIQNKDAEFIDYSYLELKNTKELHRVFFDLPKKAKPALNDIYRLSLDKNTVQNAIDEARKSDGWAKFQMLYDLHPVMKYLMTKLEASVDKEVALVAKVNQLPANTAWYVIQGQVSNNIGQSVISEYFVIPMNTAGGLNKKPMLLKEFVNQFKLSENLMTNTIEPQMLQQLEKLLPDVVDFAMEMHMHQIQQVKQLEMESSLKMYNEKLKIWERSAKEQLELDFIDKTFTGFVKRKMEDKQREIETIISESSQYYKDLTSLSHDPYLKIISVFYN